MPQGIFKLCKVCNRQWESRASFMADDEIRLIGYQANSVDVGKGLFLFNHSCEATLSIEAREFADLYHGPIYRDKKSGTSECPGYCLFSNDLHPCPVRCSCAYVREILQLLKKPDRLIF